MNQLYIMDVLIERLNFRVSIDWPAPFTGQRGLLVIFNNGDECDLLIFSVHLSQSANYEPSGSTKVAVAVPYPLDKSRIRCS